MRILHRPMFRYGGPIKEGVMHGMKNGGLSKQFNTGLVGDERYPQTGGREHHVAFLAPALYAGARMLARPFGRWAMQQVPKLTRVKWRPGGSTPSKLHKGYPGGTAKGSWERGKTIMGQQEKFVPNWLGKQFIQDPLAKTVIGGTTGLGRGLQWTGKKALGAGKYAFGTPSGLLFFGAPVTIAAGKWLLSDGTELNDDQKRQVKQSGVPGGGDPGMTYTKPPVTKSPEERAAEAKAARTAKLEKYLDTMGYDKAKKTAMGDALIDASAIVQDATTEAGSLKKADWGKMINKAIQTTSKRLDKPEQIREAVGLMLTKSEIEKDMEDPQTKELRRLQIAGAEKALAGKTLTEQVAEYTNKHGTPTGTTLSGIARSSGIDAKVYTGATEWMNKNEGKDAIDFIENEVSIAKEKGATINPGIFVVKDRIIAIDETGKITPVY